MRTPIIASGGTSQNNARKQYVRFSLRSLVPGDKGREESRGGGGRELINCKKNITIGR